MRLFKKWKRKHYNLRSELAKWVKKNIGIEYVDEAIEKYDKINRGISIGGMAETVVFLDMVETVRAEVEGGEVGMNVKEAIDVMDREKDIELRRLIDHCHYLSMRMRMFPNGHPNREKWEKELKIADKELERMMIRNGMF